MKNTSLFIQRVMLVLLVFTKSNLLYGDIIKYPNGDIYEGDTKREFPMFWKKVRYGKGKLILKEGLVVKGNWEGEKVDGDIAITSPNGDFLKRVIIGGGKYEKTRLSDKRGDIVFIRNIYSRQGTLNEKGKIIFKNSGYKYKWVKKIDDNFDNFTVHGIYENHKNNKVTEPLIKMIDQDFINSPDPNIAISIDDFIIA